MTRRPPQSRRAMVLAVTLVIIGLLAMLMAGLMYHVRAELAGAQAQRDGQQARLAAESGLQAVIAVLRESLQDSTAWYNRPDIFRHSLVWSESYTHEHDPIREFNGSREDALAQVDYPAPAWRFSVVAPHWCVNCSTGESGAAIRYGITPEASRLNLNSASEEELTRLFENQLTPLGVENTAELVACLLDWIDEDDEPRPGGAETDDYYSTLTPAYRAKNGPLATVEELLLVKGFTSAILYGEDVNRNGYLDANEDDADESFPRYDNGDGILDPGIGPFITVWSQEPGDDANQVIGKINVNTAPVQVLQVLDGMTTDATERIVSMRDEMEPSALQDAQWLVTSGALDAETYQSVQDRLTTNAFQFRVEILGYADHVKLMQRYEWVLEMRGPLAQVLYFRDLSHLGFAWRIDDDTLVLPQAQTPVADQTQ